MALGSYASRLALGLAAVTLAACLGCSMVGSTRYVGTATDTSLSQSPGSLSLTVLSGTDTSFTGWLLSGPPLAGSGSAYGWFSGDTLKLVTISEAGDTIFWFADRAGATLAGRFTVTGGRYAAQRGTWTATLVRGPVVTRGMNPQMAEFSVGVPLVVLGLVIALALFVAGAYWVRAAPRPVPATTPPVAGPDNALVGVGGWLAWFLLGQALTVVLSAGRLISDWPPWTPDSWAFGNALPGFNLLITMETAANVAQIVVPVIGIILTAKRHPFAPRLWLAYLVAMFAYGVTDVVWGSVGVHQAYAVFGDSAPTHAMSEAMGPAAVINLRLALWAVIWALYWIRSKRVRATFGHAALDSPARSASA